MSYYWKKGDKLICQDASRLFSEPLVQGKEYTCSSNDRGCHGNMVAVEEVPDEIFFRYRFKKAAGMADTLEPNTQYAYRVTYYEGDDYVDSTEIDDPSEELAWDLFAEFGHHKTVDHSLEISQIIIPTEDEGDE